MSKEMEHGDINEEDDKTMGDTDNDKINDKNNSDNAESGETSETNGSESGGAANGSASGETSAPGESSTPKSTPGSGDLYADTGSSNESSGKESKGDAPNDSSSDSNIDDILGKIVGGKSGIAGDFENTNQEFLNDFHDKMNEALGSLGIPPDAAFEEASKIFQSGQGQNLFNGLANPESLKAIVESFNKPSSGKNKINKELALNFSKASVDRTTDFVILSTDAQKCKNAISTANLWIDAWTNFIAPSDSPKVLNRTGWIDETIDGWITLANPLAKYLYEIAAEIIDEQLGEAEGEANIVMGVDRNEASSFQLHGGIKDVMKHMFSLMSSTQLSNTISAIANITFSSSDVGLPVAKDNACTLLYNNIYMFSRDIDVSFDEFLQFIALREVASSRLYNSVPYLKHHILALVAKYISTIDLDTSFLEELFSGNSTIIDPTELYKSVSNELAGKKTEEQNEAIEHLEFTLSLVEAWIDYIATTSAFPHLNSVMKIREILNRRRVTNGPQYQALLTLLGIELKHPLIQKAYTFWEQTTAKRGAFYRDSLWNHPDFLPTKETIDKKGSLESKKTSKIDKPSKSDWDASFEDLIKGFEE